MPNASTAGSIGIINNPKHASVRALTGGFIVSTNRVDSYQQDEQVAATIEDATKIISEYFAA